MRAQLESRLRGGLAGLGLVLADAQVSQLLDYLDLMGKWTRVYNLTALREPAEMLSHHLMDSLAVVEPLRRQLGQRAGRLLDVGSGAGLPGIVIAICCPQLQVDCIDAVAKKAAFVQHVAGALKLPNLQGRHGRVERTAGAYDVVASRAFASLADFVAWSSGALAEQGVWMAMKGRLPQPEIDELPVSVTVFHVEQLHVPGLNAERCIVWMKRTQR